MDPKQNSNQPLDPKLQEVYDRVMGTNPSDLTASAPTTSTQTATPSTPPIVTPPPADPVGPVVLPSDPTVPPVNPLPAGQSITGGATSTEPTTPPFMPPMPPIVPTDPTPSSSSSTGVQSEPTPPVQTPMPEPVAPLPSTDDSQPTSPVMSSAMPEPIAPQPTAPTESVSATMSMPQITHQETVKIGLGGSPVATVAKHKGKGISPLILIFGAFAFLLVYAVFWVKFFGFSIPYISQ